MLELQKAEELPEQEFNRKKQKGPHCGINCDVAGTGKKVHKN